MTTLAKLNRYEEFYNRGVPLALRRRSELIDSTMHCMFCGEPPVMLISTTDTWNFL